MSTLYRIWQALAAWFATAVPAGPPPGAEVAPGEEPDEARRRSIHDVTREQLGVTHWSCHTRF